MIIYKGISEDKKTIFYQSLSETPLNIEIKVYDTYTDSFIFNSTLENVENKYQYYTFIPQIWKNRKVMIYNKDNGELIAPFIIDGNIEMSDIDKYGYIKNLLNKETDHSHQAGIHDVLREHLIDRQYREYCDVEEGDIVVDVGFNYGIFSLGALYNGASKIYGLEPNRNVYNTIKELYPKQEIVQIYNFAISDKNEILKFKEGYNTLASSIVGDVEDYKEEYDVKCFNLFDFLNFHDIKKIDFLKIDCEGTEYNIFNSIPDDFFTTIKKIHVEYHFNDGKKIMTLIEKLERNGFEWKFEKDKGLNSDIGLIFAKKI